MTTARLITPGVLGMLIASRCNPGSVTIIGLTGSVAAGKSTLAEGLATELAPRLRVEIVQTDGFLLPNHELETRGLTLRKGYPESYDIANLVHTLQAARLRPVRIPGYSHSLYDVDLALSRMIDRPDLILAEGLGFAPASGDSRVHHALDGLVYLDATDEDLEHWFIERFMTLWHAAEQDPSSFYAQFRTLSEPEARDFARTVAWRRINLPNLRQHIVRARPLADILIEKSRNHSLRLVRPDIVP